MNFMVEMANIVRTIRRFFICEIRRMTQIILYL